MGTVTGLTKERMLAIEAACIVSGAVVLAAGPTQDHLILTRHDGSTVDAGNVRGPQGPQGPTGPGINWRGTWNPGTSYAVGDGVTYLGSSYRRLVVGTTATTPDADSTNWALFAQKGADGSPSTTPIEGWHVVSAAGEPAFQNGWVVHDPVVYPVKFRKRPDGVVQLRGLARNAASGSSTIFTLPVGYRPSEIIYAVGVSQSGPVTYTIGTDGTVVGSISTGGHWFSLGELDFDTGQSIFPASIVTVSQEGWHNIGAAGEPAFQNGWAASTGESPRFRKDPAGYVSIEGTVSGGANNTTAFTLPVGYRPDRDLYFDALSNAGASGGYVLVKSDGTLTITASALPIFFKLRFWVPQTTFPAGGLAPIPVVSALPSAPYDGQEVYFQSAAMAIDGVMWHLRYRANSSSLYKWEFVGGGPLSNNIMAFESTTSTGYTNLATVGPNIVIPLGGDFEITIGAQLQPGANDYAAATVKLGAGAAGDNENIMQAASTSGQQSYGSHTMRRGGQVAGSTIGMVYRTGNGVSGGFGRREISITPIRVG